MQINLTTKAPENFSPKAAAYIAYHASGERGTGRVGCASIYMDVKHFSIAILLGK
ncbi:hypothetical protein LEADMM271B_22715 [Leclercia adecarboxylata]